jgi:DNA-binding response OmpR family regulator
MNKKHDSKILVVDDDRYNLYILKEMLSERYEVLVASDGASALSHAESFRPDLIIQDIVLPDVNGFDLCRRLKETSSPSFVKIILISAKADLVDRLKGYDAGADDYIIKPFEKDELLAKVNVFIRLKHVEEVEKLKEDVINLFSHEVRTPLNSIVGFAELLESTTRLDKQQSELINHIILNARDLLSLAEKSIFLNSMGGNLSHRQRGVLSMRTLLEEVVKSRELSLNRKKLRLVKDITSDFSFEGEGKLLFEAIGALLDNAIKFSSSTSSILISATRENGNALITIKDQGGGFPSDFNKILTCRPTIKDINYHGRGIGIGLTFVKCVAEMHNGGLRLIESDQDGSTVELRIPVV